MLCILESMVQHNLLEMVTDILLKPRENLMHKSSHMKSHHYRVNGVYSGNMNEQH